MTWKLVPVEPTEEMLVDGTKAATGWRGTTAATYRAMLAAAPQPVVTDAMVERAAKKAAVMVEAKWDEMPPTERLGALAVFRAALTAALEVRDE